MFTNNDRPKQTESNSIDDAIQTNLRELEKVAQFYYQRGDMERANEIYQAARTIRSQIQARTEADQSRRADDLEIEPDQQSA